MNEAGKVLISRMVQLRAAVGQPALAEFEAVARQQGTTLPPQTLSPILRGERLPRWQTLTAFVTACRAKARKSGVQLDDPGLLDQDRWLEAWEACQEAGNSRERQTSRPGPVVEMHDCQGIVYGDHATMSVTINRQS